MKSIHNNNDNYGLENRIEWLHNKLEVKNDCQNSIAEHILFIIAVAFHINKKYQVSEIRCYQVTYIGKS